MQTAFEKGQVGEADIYGAASYLIVDSWLYLFEYHNSPEESLFKRLAQLTAASDEPPLRIAHCIRDLAYGNESRIDDLKTMVKSKDPRYHEIFDRCLWLPKPGKKDRPAEI